MAWKVPYIDYPQQYQKIRDELLQLVDSTLAAGDVMLRRQLRDFEENLAQFVGTKYAIGVNSGTDALNLAVRAAGIGAGDEVITVSHTMTATAAAIHHNGASVCLVDIGDDHEMDVSAVEAAITPRTKGIIPVHLNGRMCDMGLLQSIVERYQLQVIEDAAQALGASYSGQRAGSIGLAGCFSFYPAKILGTYGDGGAVVTNDEEFAEKVTLLRNHGRTKDGDVALWAFNSRLDNLHAAILDLKLKLLPDWIRRRREVANLYHRSLADLPQLRLPPPPADEGPFYDAFQNYEIEAEQRDQLVQHLNREGVEVMLSWGGKAVHQFKRLGLEHFTTKLPRTESVFKKVLMLPMHCELSDDQVAHVAEVVRDFYMS